MDDDLISLLLDLQSFIDSFIDSFIHSFSQSVSQSVSQYIINGRLNVYNIKMTLPFAYFTVGNIKFPSHGVKKC